MAGETFHEKLYQKIDELIHLAYKIARKFPKEELYGAASQLRRAALSIMLNYIEGFARKKRLVKINFFETSFGSLKECKYILEFALKENWILAEEHQRTQKLMEEISAMLWKTLDGLSRES